MLISWAVNLYVSLIIDCFNTLLILLVSLVYDLFSYLWPYITLGLQIFIELISYKKEFML